jgi:hypothetical protein
MIDCLFDYIGLQGVTSPKSSVFINRLPGITTGQLEAIRDSDDTYSVEDVWDDIQNRAIEEFEQRVNRWAANYFTNYSYVENIVSSQYDKSNSSIATGSNYTGWLFDDGYDSWYKNMRLQIPYVDLYTSNAVNSSIRIYNAVTGDLLDEVTFNSAANTVNRIQINKSYARHTYPKIFVAYDDSVVQTIQATDLSYSSRMSFAEKTVSKASTVIDDNLSAVGSSGQGLIVTFSLDCSLENYICQRRDLFQTPFLYLLAYHFCWERINSDRINHYTLMDREKAQELANQFLNEWEEMIKGTLEGLTFNGWDEFCFICEREVNQTTLLP